LSPAYLKSDYCIKEYTVTLAGDPLNRKERLIVLRLQECAPEGMLTDIPYTDLAPILANSNAQQRGEHLARVIRVVIGVEERSGEIDSVNLYRRKPQQIVHREIDANRGFTGRESELEALKDVLWNKGGTAAITNAQSNFTALCGLGGIGKSVLAREYAWRNREHYYGIWWIRAERRETLLNDLIELGSRYIPSLSTLANHEDAALAARFSRTRGLRQTLVDRVRQCRATERYRKAYTSYRRSYSHHNTLGELVWSGL
jgi:hypothetical protein